MRKKGIYFPIPQIIVGNSLGASFTPVGPGPHVFLEAGLYVTWQLVFFKAVLEDHFVFIEIEWSILMMIYIYHH